MNKVDKEKMLRMLNKAVENYFSFRNRDDFPDKPCVRQEANARQHSAFTLADCLYQYGFITFEECCEIWSKIGFTDENADCSFPKCNANINGKCKYIVEEYEKALAEQQGGNNENVSCKT